MNGTDIELIAEVLTNRVVLIVGALAAVFGACQMARHTRICKNVCDCWLVNRVYGGMKKVLQLGAMLGLVKNPDDSPVDFIAVDQKN